MVTAIQVPFRAYGDESLFINVNDAPSLCQDLQNKGFYNAFISTYEYQPFVPTRKNWNKIYERKDLPNIDGWLSLESSRMESATEDKAAISTVVDLLVSHDRTFVLHELVYGHSIDWKAKTGKTKMVYYNEYLVDLTDKLVELNLLDNTLLVIVSDHGDRAKPSVIENYRVPLLVLTNQNKYEVRDDLLSQLDLSKVIYHYIASDEHPKSREDMFLVGSTERWIYGKLNKDKSYLFIDDPSGTVLNQFGGMEASEVRDEFQNRLDVFNMKYGKKWDIED